MAESRTPSPTLAPVGIVLGLAVAAAFGGADFLGGLTSRRSQTGSVVLTAQWAGLLLGLVWLGLFASGKPAPVDLTLGACAGVSNVVGVAALYRGLGAGRMGVVAPISAVVAAGIPIVWGLVRGERPSVLSLVGVGLALVAVVLIAHSAEEDVRDKAASWTVEVALAIAAGIGFGISFVLYAETSPDSGFWPVVAARATAVPLVLVTLGATHRAFLPNRGDLPTALGAGLLDVTATALLLVAVRQELVSLVAPVSALYPGFTVLLARVVLTERLAREQIAGLAFALCGLVLIAIGSP